MTACASLSMYDLPELRAETDAWWQGLAAALGRAGLKDVPQRLDRRRPSGLVLRDPNLLLGQTCGYPLMYELNGIVRLVATPVYEARGCDGPTYASAIVVREADRATQLGDLAGRVCAFNGRNSQSGYNALRRSVAELAQGRAFFARTVETGAHARSLEAVAQRKADVAAVDGVSYALLARVRPRLLEGLRVLDWTRKAPCLPYVTAVGAGRDTVERLIDGLRAAIAAPDLASVRAALLLRDFAVLPLSAYRPVTEMADEAMGLGYPELA